MVFPVPMRRAIELREQYAGKGGFDAVKVRIRLSNGQVYSETGKLDFVDNKIALDTDTLLPVQSLRIRSSSHRQLIGPVDIEVLEDDPLRAADRDTGNHGRGEIEGRALTVDRQVFCAF
jgi:hypothetical protein